MRQRCWPIFFLGFINRRGNLYATPLALVTGYQRRCGRHYRQQILQSHMQQLRVALPGAHAR